LIGQSRQPAPATNLQPVAEPKRPPFPNLSRDGYEYAREPYALEPRRPAPLFSRDDYEYARAPRRPAPLLSRHRYEYAPDYEYAREPKRPRLDGLSLLHRERPAISPRERIYPVEDVILTRERLRFGEEELVRREHEARRRRERSVQSAFDDHHLRKYYRRYLAY